MRRIICIIGGTVFLVIGLIGLALPVIPQVPFLVIAALLLARGSERVRRRITGSGVYRKYLKGRDIKWLKELEAR